MRQNILCICYYLFVHTEYVININEYQPPLPQDAQEVDQVVRTMEGGPYQEYFYITVPIGDGGRSRRFLYVHRPQEGGNNKRFPMQFGTQVLTVAELIFCAMLLHTPPVIQYCVNYYTNYA
jgi:hypothetical protein